MGYYNLLERRLRKLESALCSEAKQVGTLYHVCTLKDYLTYIEPRDILSASGNYHNWLYGDIDYVSFTRDKYFTVATSNVSRSNVLIQLVVDGDKLSETYKVGPYNDIAYDYDGNHDFDSDYFKYREMEEAVKGPIKNISRYIKEIHIDVKDKVNRIDADLIYNNLSKLSNCTYYRFIRGSRNNTLTQFMSRLKNGDSVDDLYKALDQYCDLINTDLSQYMLSNDLNSVKRAIELGADPNGRYSRGSVTFSPLEYYCDDRSTDIFKYLLSVGANPNKLISKYYNETLLMKASMLDNAGIVKLLLNAGADLDAHNRYGYSALALAAKCDADNVIPLLVSAGADIDEYSLGNGNIIDLADKQSNSYKVLKRLGAKSHWE